MLLVCIKKYSVFHWKKLEGLFPSVPERLSSLWFSFCLKEFNPLVILFFDSILWSWLLVDLHSRTMLSNVASTEHSSYWALGMWLIQIELCLEHQSRTGSKWPSQEIWIRGYIKLCKCNCSTFEDESGRLQVWSRTEGGTLVSFWPAWTIKQDPFLISTHWNGTM